MPPDTGKLMEMVLTEVRGLGDRVSKLDVSLAALIAELRATQKADQASMAVLTKDVEDLKQAVDDLKSVDHQLELEQVMLKTKIALPASVLGLAASIAALISHFT